MEEDFQQENQDKKRGVLGRLAKKLYIKGAKLPKTKRSKLRFIEKKEEDEHRYGWASFSKDSLREIRDRETKRMSFVKKIFFISVVFFIAASSVFFFVIISGIRTVSPDNVEILISSPVSIEAGKELQLQVIIENKNDTSLEFTDLIIKYPEGTRAIGDLEKEITRVRKTLGTINAQGIVKVSEEVVLFGSEGERKEITVILEYRLRDSNAILATKKRYEVFISASPIALGVSTLKEVTSGKEFEISLVVTSNSNNMLKNLLLHMEYPFGFSFVGATPQPAYGKDTWRIGDLEPGGKRIITLKGVLVGQNGEEKIFKIESGLQKKDDARTIGIVYASSVDGIEITRPFLSMDLLFDRSPYEEYVLQSREPVAIDLVWLNTLPTKIIDVRIEVRLEGEALDKRSVIVKDGFYRSSDNTILWDSGTLQNLREIESGSDGGVSFRLASNSLVREDGSIIKDPQIAIEVDAYAKRISEAGVPEEIRSSVSRVVKVRTNTSVAQRVVYYTGPFTNVGPIPPRVEQDTTYTIIWTVVNTANPLAGTIATATLPPYVKWVGTVTPKSEDVVFIENNRTIRWSLGDVEIGAGITSSPREIAFQVMFTPSISHLQTIPTLVPNISLVADDQFADVPITAFSGNVTTNLTTDPQFNSINAKVQE